MVKFLVLAACLLAVASVQARKIPLSAVSLKYKNLNYFENDPDIMLQEDDSGDNTPVSYQGDNMKAKIVTQENYQKGKGKFKYALNTENGISVQQAGKLKDGKTFVVQGSYSYTGADGRRYRVRYTADEFGYHPKTELEELDIPDLDANQNDIPDVTPFKPTFEPIRVQKQTPSPLFQQKQELVTLRPATSQFQGGNSFGSDPYGNSGPAQLLDTNSFGQNPYGNSGPFVGNNYLPPTNDYLPPGNAPLSTRAVTSGHGDFLFAPAASTQVEESDSVFRYT